MKDVCKTIILGNVGSDPIIRTMKNGRNVANFTVATNKKFKDSEGTLKSITKWHRMVCYGSYSAVIEKYVKKGRRVYVECEIQYSKYTDKNGVERDNIDFVLEEIKFQDLLSDSVDNNKIEPNGNIGNRVPDDYKFDDNIPF